MSGRQIRVAQESPRQPPIVAMLAELDAYLMALYPPESNHLLDIDELCRPDVRFFVARVDGEVAGCGAMRIARDHVEIKRMYVVPAMRGSGVGWHILRAIEDAARELGIATMRLEAGHKQPQAEALYRRAGYRECAAFAPYLPDPLSLFMEKRLDA